IAEGYKTRDYEIEINQGENKLFNFRLVEDFAAVFLRNIARKPQLFISDLDGVNSEQLTFIDNFNPFSYEFNHSESTIYFLSAHERQKGMSSNIRLAYSFNTSSNQLTRITDNNFAGLDKVYANFKAKKLFNIASLRSGFGSSNQ